ncbi:MAG: aldo/keto reductase [Rikenellaceae bacterium]
MSEKKNINRRDFLKYLGGTAAATAIASCTDGQSESKASAKDTSAGMTYRTVKTTGDKLSLLGYGCMRWPRLATPAADGNVIDQQAVNELIDHAIANGVNYFDTSPVYVQGWSERATGVALARHPRESYYIATKLSNNNVAYHSAEQSLAMYKRSFEYLQVDYIDYMLLHTVGSNGWEHFKSRYIDNGILDFLIEERKAGRIRNLGFSFHGDGAVFEYLLSRHDEIKWDFAQIQLNYVDWKHANKVAVKNINGDYLYAELEKRDIDVVIMEPLLGGRLAQLPEYLAAKLREQRPSDSIASWAFRYAGSFPKVVTVLSGMTYMEHLEENLNTYSPLEEITPEENELLMDIADMMIDLPLVPCTACQYCMPCPYGLDIPSIFVHYNKCVCEDYYPQSSQDENFTKARKAFLVGYDRSVPKLRQANHCINCQECLEHCPQSIEIPTHLRRIDDYVESLKQNKL